MSDFPSGFFGSSGKVSIKDFFKEANSPPPKKPDNIKQIHEYANQLALEDSIERLARTTPVQTIILGPNLDSAYQWIVTVVFASKENKSSFNPFNLGDISGPIRKQSYYKSFEHAEAFLEKNNYFNCKPTKRYEGIYASWDA